MPVQGVLAVFPRDVVLSALLSCPASLMPNLPPVSSVLNWLFLPLWAPLNS